VTGASRPAAPRPVELPSILGDIHPRPRWTETRLLLIVGVALIVGSISLGAGLTGRLAPYEPTLLVIYLLTLAGAHVANVLAGRRSDEVLLPVVGLLGGISLLLMQRLPQDLVLSHELGLPENHPRIFFSQLYGMGDNISYMLASRGYNVSKYVPYGPVEDAIPYLIRRAEENTSAAGHMSRQLEMITRELKRRKLS